MCGIAGFFLNQELTQSVNVAELNRVRDHMRARSLDGTGPWISQHGRGGLVRADRPSLTHPSVGRSRCTPVRYPSRSTARSTTINHFAQNSRMIESPSSRTRTLKYYSSSTHAKVHRCSARCAECMHSTFGTRIDRKCRWRVIHSESSRCPTVTRAVSCGLPRRRALWSILPC